MNELEQNIVHANTLVNLLVEKTLLNKTGIKDLSEIANRYPYFGFVQFLLAKKLSAGKDVNAAKQLQQCALYFSNPFWLHYLLSEDGITNGVFLNESTFTSAATETEVLPEQPQERIEEEDRNYSQSGATPFTKKHEIQNTAEQSEEKLEDVSKENLKPNGTPLEISTKTEVATEQFQQKIKEENKSFSVESLTDSEKTSTKTQTVTEQTSEKIGYAGVTPVDESNDTTNIEEKNFEPIDSITNAVEEVVKKNQENITEETSEEEPLPEASNEETGEDAEREKLSKLIEQHLSEFRKPLESGEEIPITTRVYHAIDYFASQGIKLDPRLISEDKLGSKVKKFTDWLKQMKRVNENPTDLGTDTETEHLIEKIAQTANETKDVITETMAQVLVKQGKIEKAIQLYQKLSFLNPSKTTYFAAKINELKGIK